MASVALRGCPVEPGFDPLAAEFLADPFAACLVELAGLPGPGRLYWTVRVPAVVPTLPAKSVALSWTVYVPGPSAGIVKESVPYGT
jgi:hypothetical protein